MLGLLKVELVVGPLLSRYAAFAVYVVPEEVNFTIEYAFLITKYEVEIDLLVILWFLSKLTPDRIISAVSFVLPIGFNLIVTYV